MGTFLAAILAWVTSQTGIITLVVSTLVAFIARKYPREKLFDILLKIPAIAVGKAINIFLLRFLPKKLAVMIEEGILCSLLYILRQFFYQIELTILEDNATEVINSPLPKREAMQVLLIDKKKEEVKKIEEKVKTMRETVKEPRESNRGI